MSPAANKSWQSYLPGKSFQAWGRAAEHQMSPSASPPQSNPMKHFVRTSQGKRIFHRCLAPPYSLGSPPFDGAEFVVLIVNNDPHISSDDQYAVSLALVRAGCRYAVCIGHNCSMWDDSVDWAYLEVAPEPKDETFVMTSWHENDTPEEIAHFFMNCMNFGNNVFENYLVLSLGSDDLLLADLKRALGRCQAITQYTETEKRAYSWVCAGFATCGLLSPVAVFFAIRAVRKEATSDAIAALFLSLVGALMHILAIVFCIRAFMIGQAAV